ncbi:craniofacial development protein 1-like [Argiope bruennichi]|uniref:Craniofacial development protein 1 n=1 Tax=Argiope bruennichi TaxID=94029 RepID=A0A8T0F1U2_ARGBR|nr:craniofacial development protein 1-like [Argiope bruennichi]KAF8784801.1 Craniofacial development protein 1 like protein [Argiope bruennichi]
MASILDLSASSDSEDDVDYVPPTNAAASDSSFDEEDVSEDEGFNSGELIDKKPKATKKEQPAEADKEAEIKSGSPAQVDEKQRAKDLWESFLSDVESIIPKKSNPAVCNGSTTAEIQNGSEVKDTKIEAKPMPKVFEFAGETVTVDKDLNSCDSTAEKNNSAPIPTAKPLGMPKKRGIESVLGAIMNKNKKLTVLEKTVIDWKTFKKDEGLDNDLEKFNKGKQGFIERQRFLERSDLRSFEVEKSMRQTLRKK